MPYIKYKNFFFILLVSGLIHTAGISAQTVYTLVSGTAKINVVKAADSQYNINFYFNGVQIPLLDAESPVYLEVAGQKFVGKYSTCSLVNDTLDCSALLTTVNGTQFFITDKYVSYGNEQIELKRNLNIKKGVLSDRYFNSLFGFQVSTNSQLTDNEFFIPAVWYKGNFESECNLPASNPQATDSCFYYREDRIPLPLVMFRNRLSGKVISILHKNSNPTTVMADDYNAQISADYQYGALGIKQVNNSTYETFIYPGSEATRKSGIGYRSHPVRTGITQQYDLMLSFKTSKDYASALQKTWNDAFSIYNPTIYPVDLSSCYNGLIETLLKYYVPSTAQGGIRDAPGFPFQVGFDDFQPMGIDYQMGFVGMQIPTGYYIFRYGIEDNNSDARADGEAILNFWANNSLSSLGYPRTWYDPGLNGASGSFRAGSDLRVCTGGMEGLLSAWCFAKKNNISRSYWLKACTRFGDWLVANQNNDGSFYYSYDHNVITNGKHPVTDYNKYLTICTIRYLTELFIATGNSSYKDAVLKAGEFCYININQNYHYLACVIDNAHSYDSESGQMAMNGFLALYGLTDDSKWLAAAEQAATYTETWVYSFEIPVEKDRTTPTSFPKDRSIVGQHLIAISHGAADLGLAYSAFVFYELYLATGNEHYLQVARMSAHNTKQSMNWDQSLYPGQAKGLQLEAFPVTIPRRSNGVETTLNWNYAANLDPMFRFKDAFGTPDMEKVFVMPKDEQLRLINTYYKVQSSNYGQNDVNSLHSVSNNQIKIYPNPAATNEDITLQFQETSGESLNLEIYNIDGTKVYGKQLVNFPFILSKKKINLLQGEYILKIIGENYLSTSKLIIK